MIITTKPSTSGSLDELVVGDTSNSIDDGLIVGDPIYLDVATVFPTPVYVKGDKGDPGDPGAITPEFVDRVSDEVAIDLTPTINLVLLFDNALA